MALTAAISIVLFWTTLVGATHACGRTVPDPSRSVTLGNLTVEVCRSGAVRVLRGHRDRDSLVVVEEASEGVSAVRIERHQDGAVMETDDVTVLVDKDGRVSFYVDGEKVLEEHFHKTENETVTQSWLVNENDSMYGGGQYVNGLMDYSVAPLRLRQFNTEAAVPFFSSTGGYGILWDLYGDTVLNPTDTEISLKVVNEINNKTATGDFLAPQDGDLYLDLELCDPAGFGCDGTSIQMTLATLDGKTVSECGYNLFNAPSYISCRAENVSGGQSYKVRVEWDARTDRMPRVLYHSKPIKGTVTLQSKDTNFIDYYFVPAHSDNVNRYNFTTMDSVMSSYRKLTGQAPLLSRKAYGFWQCRERYMNQTHLLSAAHKYRQLQIPVDNIVQDWQYWGDFGWGPQWDRNLYPDPAAMVKELDGLNLDLMVSVWSRFDEKTRFWQEMNAAGLLIPETQWFDAWNSKAGETFFRYADEAHFSIGVAYLWLDATEPENNPHLGQKVFGGTGDSLRNSYSLEVPRAIHEGYVKKYKNRRPFALTRSSFPGQQRYGATLWSGDTSGSWDSLRRQVAMSINYGLSGIPLWTCDTGGFFRPSNQYGSPDYRLLLVRWFQFSTFTPLLRVHGMASETEVWNYGKDTQDLIVESAIHFRYRLLPYLYSGFWRVKMEGYTMQRGLAMDFPNDFEVRNIPDQYMFGESFVVAPIYEPSSSRTVCLPALKEGGVWRDFYTGKVVESGYHKLDNVRNDQIPLFVRSSIVVLGPVVQHAMDPAAMSSLEVRIYPGRDSTFVLYEDDGRDPSKDRPFTTIRFSWNDAEKRLTVGPRDGREFPGMVAMRTIRALVVRPGVGVGVATASNWQAVSQQYNGKTQLTFDLSQDQFTQTVYQEMIA